MVSPEQVREIALFFLLSLMDEKVALSAAHKSIAQLKSMKNDAHTQVEIARVLRRSFDSHRKMLSRNRPTEMGSRVLWFPDGTDFVTWQKFYRSSSDAEVVALIFTRILGYGEAAVAEGLNVSSGTMKYRVAKGIRQLGGVLAKSGASA